MLMTAMVLASAAIASCLVLTGVVILNNAAGIHHADRKAEQAQTDVQRQVAGRRVAISVICGFANGVADAGRQAISTPRLLPPRLEQLFERYGYPTFKQRQRAAHAFADAYARRIAQAVAKEAGAQYRDLVRADGSLNCAVLKRVARSASSP